jgi:hypothetical protein
MTVSRHLRGFGERSKLTGSIQGANEHIVLDVDPIASYISSIEQRSKRENSRQTI